eukprot:2964931-Pleurochrysis_carterae.AAC.1
MPRLVPSRLGCARCSLAPATRRLNISLTRRLLKLLHSCGHWRRVDLCERTAASDVQGCDAVPACVALSRATGES